MGSGMDLGAIEYSRMEIGFIWTSARVGIVLIGFDRVDLIGSVNASLQPNIRNRKVGLNH